MRIEDLQISRAVALKILRKHRVVISEVFEMFWNEQDKVMIRRSPSRSESYIAFGRTESGRYLIAAFILEKQTARVLTVRDMKPKERRLYKEG